LTAQLHCLAPKDSDAVLYQNFPAQLQDFLLTHPVPDWWLGPWAVFWQSNQPHRSPRAFPLRNLWQTFFCLLSTGQHCFQWDQ